MEYVLIGLVLGKSVLDWWTKRKLQANLDALAEAAAATEKHWEETLRKHGIVLPSLGGGKTGGD